MFEALATQRLYRQVAERIVREIRTGRLAVGDRLPAERDLAQQFRVSRPTVREAIIALEIAGYVEVRVGLGVFVVSRAPTNALFVSMAGPGPFELIEARQIVEGEIAALAANAITDEALAELERCIDLMIEENRNDYASFEGDRRFHLLIAEQSRNSAFVDIVRYFWEQRSNAPMWSRLHEHVSPADIRPMAVDEHRQIVKALTRRSPTAARRAMQRHISRVAATLLDRWNALPDGERALSPNPQEVVVERLPSAGAAR